MKKLLKKIDLINSMLDQVNNAEEMPITYAGGTWPYYVLIQPIEVKNQFVTIRSTTDKYSFIDGKERYNMNKDSIMGDQYCAEHLNYTLNTILKAFKKVTK
jgi:hypothetical protein